MKYLTTLLLLYSLNLFADVNTIEALYETTPIPAGLDSTDDIAIWLHPEDAAKSLIAGVSKTKPKAGNHAGIGLYNLQGRQIKYLEHDRLNNVDIKYNFNFGSKAIDIAVASNRDKKALSVFEISENSIRLLTDLPLLNQKGNPIDEEPYGICLSHSISSGAFYVFTPLKSGIIYQHELLYQKGVIVAQLVDVIDASVYLSEDQNQHLLEITLKEVILEKDLAKDELVKKLLKKLKHRFQIEGCVSDDENNILYYGMENLGVWKLALGKKPYQSSLIVEVQSAKSEINTDTLAAERPKFTTDIEGLALHYGPNGEGALLVSVQGLNEYAWIDRKTDRYLGSFKISYGNADPVTDTDGLEILSTPLGREYPSGILVVHDDHNTDDQGELQNANYKIINLGTVLDYFPALKYNSFLYNPRQ